MQITTEISLDNVKNVATVNRQERLIKPTRNNAPTEYNVKYKRWHKSGNNRHTDANAIDIPVKPGKLVKPGRLHSANDPTRINTPFHSRPWTTETEKNKIYKRPTSYVDQYAIERQPGSKDGYLQSNQHRSRPSSSKVAGTKLNDADPEFKENYRTQSGNSSKTSPRKPVTPKTAWVGDAELEDKNRPKAVSYSPKSTTRTSDNQSALLKDEPVVHASSLLRYNSSVMPKSPECTFENAWKNNRPSSRHLDKRYDNDDGRQTPEIKVKSAVTAFQKSRDARGASREEKNLKEVYAHATESEIKRLLAEIKGRPKSREIAARKQSPKNSSRNTSETSVSKYDLDKLREAAYRGCIQVPPFCRKDVWSTTYNKTYGRNWKPENYMTPYNTDYDTSKELKHDANVYCDVEVKDHYIASDFAKTNNLTCKISDVSLTEHEQHDSDDESSCGSNNGRSRTPPGEPNQSHSVTEWAETVVDATESEKLLGEANEIEEKEFKDLFKEDGRPKMTGDTTTGMAHNGAQGPRYEDPIWADPTVTSLGSGHWNLLWNHYYNWETSGKFDKSKKLCDMTPKKIENNKYKIMMYDQGEPGPTVKNQLTKDMVFGKYGGGGIPRKTHVCYVTEYMGKFTEMPLQRNRRRV